MLTDSADKNSVLKIVEFIDLFRPEESSTFRGWLFEGVAHRFLLESRVAFPVRLLRDSSISTPKLNLYKYGELCLEPYNNIEDITSIQRSVYYRPNSSNNKSFDSFLILHRMLCIFQMTTSV